MTQQFHFWVLSKKPPTNLKKIHAPHVHCSQAMETIEMPIDEWMDKENVKYRHTHTQHRILFSHKNETLPFMITWT